MIKYRKKPVVIEAIQFTGTNENVEVLKRFINRSIITESSYLSDYQVNSIVIETLEGDMTANVGDYIIKGIKGEYYPCKPDIFNETYERVEE